MYDELRQSFETFQQNVNKLALNVKHEKFIHLQQMTLRDMFKQSKFEPCQKKIVHLTRCVRKREFTVRYTKILASLPFLAFHVHSKICIL
jgi:t-SNARE complex subunit (syntaxin)